MGACAGQHTDIGPIRHTLFVQCHILAQPWAPHQLSLVTNEGLIITSPRSAVLEHPRRATWHVCTSGKMCKMACDDVPYVIAKTADLLHH